MVFRLMNVIYSGLFAILIRNNGEGLFTQHLLAVYLIFTQRPLLAYLLNLLHNNNLKFGVITR